MADFKRLGKGVTGALAKAREAAQAQKDLRVYHGSPHRIAPVPENPLGKFDSSKIGTGEGGAAYGIGHYLAQAKPVAKTYQPRSPLHEEKLLKEYKKAEAKQDYAKMEVLEDAMMHRSPKEIVEKFTNMEDGYTPEHIKAASEFAKWSEKNKPEVGGLYHIDLPKESIGNMLDWDKPLSQQDVLRILNPRLVNDSTMFDKAFSMEAVVPIGNGNRRIAPITKTFGSEEEAKAALESMTGADLYNILSQTSMPSGASDFLRQAGIPGLKYYDEGSRHLNNWEVGKSGSGTWMLKNHELSPNQWKEFPTEDEAKAAYRAIPDTGTRNFVVFPGNEDIAKIVDREKNGGVIHMADAGRVVRGGLSAIRNASRAADQALEAKRLALEAATPQIKASEAYGQHEGAYMKPIFYDRMKVDLSEGKKGGPGFSGIQLVDPDHALAKAAAGVTDQKMATRILNRNEAQVPKGAKVIWTPSVGGLEQHKSNSTLFSKVADIFAGQRKNMSNDEIQKLSDYASTKVDNKGKLIFPNGIDLGSNRFRQKVTTYNQRALMADIFAGRGVGGEKGRTVPVEELLEKNLDPNVAGAGTLDLGNRLFRLDGSVIDRPDLHSDYRKILTGEDLNVNYTPVPIRDVYTDWEAQKKLELLAQGKDRDVTQMDYTKNDPTVQLTEALLTKMQKAGQKKGGVVRSEESPEDMARFQKRFAMHKAMGGSVKKMAGGGRVSIFDAPVKRMAEGGGSNYHPDVQDALKAGRITPNQAKWMSNYARTAGNPEIGTAGINDGISEKMMNYRKAVLAGEHTRPNWMGGIPKEVKTPYWASGKLDLDREGLRQLDKIPGMTKKAFNASEYSNTFPAGTNDMNYYNELLKASKETPDYQPYVEEMNKLKERNPDIGKASGGRASIFDKPVHMIDGGKVAKGVMGAVGKASRMADDKIAAQAIGKAAESAGMKAPVTANKSLTTMQDFHTSMGDSMRQRAARDKELMDSFNYKYDKGQRVFTEQSAQQNWPPLTVLSRALEGNRMMREDPNDILSKKIIDPETGKAKRTPPEPGYRVRLEHSPDHWSESLIPESAIKGSVDMARGGVARMVDGGKIAKGITGALTKASRMADAALETPAVNRLDMNFKDVTKRVPELTDAANKLAAGELSSAKYDALVNKVKPVSSYSFVPQPATTEDAMRALTENKKAMFGKTNEMTAGEQADLRLDIPAYKDHGVWVNSIHRKDEPTVYGSVSSVKNASMIGAPDKALKVAQGGPKAPFAVIRGEWNPVNEESAVKNAQKYLNHKDWRQVGYDPERHGYFYDRTTMEPITNAEEVLQIGPLVLAKKPVYGKKSEEKYSGGGSAHQESPADMARFNKRFAMHKAIGGSVKKPQKFDGGGIASPEESSGSPPDREQTKAGLMAEFLAKAAKDQGKEELSSLKKPRAVTDLLNRGVLANNPVSAVIDMVNMGLVPLDALGSKLTGRDIKVSSDKPFLGSEHLKDLMNEYNITSGEERPMMETALSFASPVGMIKGAQKTADLAKKAPEALNTVRGGLETMSADVQRPFRSATLTMEGVAPDLGQKGNDKFKDLITKRMITGEGAPVSMERMGGRKTEQTMGQGLYENFAKQLETNPMVGITIPRAGNLSTNKRLIADIGTAGRELGQEMVAAHKFTPLMFKNPKDATAMMIGGSEPLTKDQIRDIYKLLPGMIVTHSPKNNSMFIAPFEGDALDYKKAAQAANEILGKGAKVQFGKADSTKDIMYRGDYKEMEARPPSTESTEMRNRLKKAEERIVRGPSVSQSGRQSPPSTLTSTVR